MNTSGRVGRGLKVPVVALVAVAAVLAGSLVATAQTEPQLRLQARILHSGRIEMALQQRLDGEQWSDRLLPARRFVPADAPSRRWLESSPLAVDTSGGAQEFRIAARRHSDGRVEVALQHRRADGTWSGRILPALRFVPADVTRGRWLASSPLAEPAPSDEAEPLDDPDSGSPAGAEGGAPPPDGDADVPRALVTPTGVPVAVIGRAGGGYLVRTPCGDTAQIASGEPIHNVRVVLDPGHGGRFEVGAVGPNGLAEDELNLTLSRAVLAELARRGIAAAATRTGDYGSLLWVRAAFADALGADALISIHHNAPTHRLSDSPGTEVYVQSTDDETPRAASERLGGLLYEEIATALAGFEGISWSRLPNAGVLRVLLPDGGDAYGMIRRPKIPAVLMEYGYLSNPSEAELFATDEYIAVAAAATADAVEAYLNTDRPGTGFVTQPRRFDPAPAPSQCDELPLE